MAANGKTPARVVELINTALSEKSLTAVSKEIGLGAAVIRRYSNGIGEPSAGSLHKLSDYFGVPVGWLRNAPYKENGFNIVARFLLDENRRVESDRDGDLYLDDFVGLLSSFYALPAHKREFARGLLERAQRWFNSNS